MSASNDFFAPKHKRLANFASIANIFAWIVLIFYMLYAVLSFRGAWLAMREFFVLQPGYDNEVIEIITRDPVRYASLFSDTLALFVRGFVFWLILKSMSLGLNMIVETDLNYREKYPERTNE